MFDTGKADRDGRHSLAIHLMRNGSIEFHVSEVEMTSGGLRNTYEFTDSRPIYDVFIRPVADILTAQLSGVSAHERSLTMPDLVIEQPGITLAGVTVILTVRMDGTECAVMKFDRYIGDIKSVLTFEQSMDVDAPTAREQIAVEVLRDIVSPLVDLVNLNNQQCVGVIENNADMLQRRLDAISLRQEELGFYSGLLQRFVMGTRQDIAGKSVRAAQKREGGEQGDIAGKAAQLS